MVAAPSRIPDLVPVEGCVAKERPHGSRSRVLWIPGVPSTKQLGRATESSRQYQDRVRRYFNVRYPDGPIGGPVRLAVYVITDAAGDVDNFAKAICDALHAAAYTNDAQIVHLDVIKLPTCARLPAGTLVLVTPVGDGWVTAEQVAATLLYEAAPQGR